MTVSLCVLREAWEEEKWDYIGVITNRVLMLEFIKETQLCSQDLPMKIYNIKGPAWYQNHISIEVWSRLCVTFTYFYILVMSSVNLLKNNLILQKDQLNIHHCSSYKWDPVGLFLLIRHVILLWVAKTSLQIVHRCKIPIEGNHTILCDAASDGVLFNPMADHVIKGICRLHGLDLNENKVF